MIARTLATALLLTAFNGCAVIHFENGTIAPDPIPDAGFDWSLGLLSEPEPAFALNPASSVRYRRWYHHAIFSLAELSNPMQFSVDCAGLEWNQVTTEVTLRDFIFGLADNALFYNASSAGLDLWSPWSIEYSCR